MGRMSEEPGSPPPLPPTPYPDDLLARCATAFVSASVRSARAELEVHRTHLRIVSPVVRQVSEFARRMTVDDLVLSYERIDRLRPIGTMTVVVELPHRAAVALAGPAVRETLGHAPIDLAPRRFRPFFVNFWLIHNRTGRVDDSRPMT